MTRKNYLTDMIVLIIIGIALIGCAAGADSGDGFHGSDGLD